MTNSVTYLENVTITVDKKYSRSYGNKVEKKFNFAIIDGDWIELYNIYSCGKMKISAKHFHDYKGTVITERQFKLRTKKLQTAFEQKREEEKIEKEKKQAEYNEYVISLKNELQNRIIEVMPKIKEFTTLEKIDARLNKDMTLNEVCNRAVGIVGYEFAKHLGWMFVLRQIKENY